jgi:hypothetical protein
MVWGGVQSFHRQHICILNNEVSMKNRRWWLLLIPGLLLVGMLGFVLWASAALGPSQIALDALKSDKQVEVTVSNSQIVFKPVGKEPRTGLIFYPGGKVDFRSYAPQLHQVASQGYLVVLVRVPLNLAIFGVETASGVIKSFPQVAHWALAGHSLGGSMAALYVYNHPDTVRGLVLWASYPASNNNLSSRALKVTSIYGTLDGLATGEKIAASKPLLPATTNWVAIEGGDHAQFGSYGVQPGDNPAAISAQSQLDQTVKATADLLKQIDLGG